MTDVKLRPEDLGPPTPAVIEMMRERAGQRWPGVNVSILWVWTTGQTRLHFEWSPRDNAHRKVTRLNEGSRRVMCAMSYSGLIDEIQTLKTTKKEDKK